MPNALDLLLPSIDGPAVALGALLEDRERLVLVFAHSDCPTSTLALRRLSQLGAHTELVCIAEEPPEQAARLARRTGVVFPMLAEPEPFELSRALEIRTVPTAVVITRDGMTADTIVGWDADAYEGLLSMPLGEEGPRRKPGCGARWTYEAAEGGLDELEDMLERGWSDGLPVVPPTPERVEAMLGDRDAARSLGPVPPSHGQATLERVAACAVLAGCRPLHFPLVVAAVEAALEPAFNAHGLAVTTQPAGPVVIVNGPVRDAAGLNSGIGALGPGTRANMTVGRALRLVLTLTGGARPGGLDRSTLGNPGKLGLCIAESEEVSPWEPLHVERGFERDSSTVTVLSADAPLSISDHRSKTPEELAGVFAVAASATWSPYWWPMDDDSLFVVCPEHAALFATAGWSKERVRAAVFAAATRPAGELKHGETTPQVHASESHEPIHKWTSPERIQLIVAGGEAGRFSAVLGPCDGLGTQMITKEVQWST